ncbi:MAG: hypothetical protein Q9186_007682, partial [Xanthomendoza sp. 1 TL-2023]
MTAKTRIASTTLSIDLTKDWTNDSVVFQSTTKPPGAPQLSSSSLWLDKEQNVFYSGFTGRASTFGDGSKPPPLAIWSFKPDGKGSGSWEEAIGAEDPRLNDLTRSDRGYTASGGGSALLLGGISNSQTNPDLQDLSDDVRLSGLVEFNMTRQTFRNGTAKWFNGAGGGEKGKIHYVPSFGPDGLFMIMGGESENYIEDEGKDDNLGLDTIWAYDHMGNRAYKQVATGEIPKPRRDFCLAGLSSRNGTYEIFLYGGYNGNLGPDAVRLPKYSSRSKIFSEQEPQVPYDEIYILTLPAFHWLKVNYPPQHPRHGHSCNAIGGSQIISVGGLDSNAKIYTNASVQSTILSTFNSSIDPFAQGLGIFDMTTLKWADHFTANKSPYVQSDMVRSFYNN